MTSKNKNYNIFLASMACSRAFTIPSSSSITSIITSQQLMKLMIKLRNPCSVNQKGDLSKPILLNNFLAKHRFHQRLIPQLASPQGTPFPTYHHDNTLVVVHIMKNTSLSWFHHQIICKGSKIEQKNFLKLPLICCGLDLSFCHELLEIYHE